MYRMDADGVVFHDPSLNDDTRLAMGTEATLEINRAGSLRFTLPPGNVVYKTLRKRKSVVTLYQGSEIIFRGRVLDTVMDLQNLCEVYCEGELALLIDSLQPPIEYKGSADGYFRQMVANHNATMDADKQFVVGEVSAVTSEHEVDVETDEYRETLDEMRSLLVNEFGGYLRVRYSGGVRYLDYIKEYNSSSNQKIQFGVNLVDVERRNDTINLCTVLVPVGKKNLTIANVNGGSVYLEDAAAIAQYGRIEKVKKFERIEAEAELLEYGQKAMEQIKAERSITIKAVDMKILDDGADSILLGDRVYLDSEAHELSETELCTKAVIKIDTPEQSEYTFGTPAEKLTDNLSGLKKKVDSDYDKLKDWLTVTDTELTLAKQWISETGDIVSNVMFKMDAMNANILLKADQTVVNEMETRISNAEILIDGANAKIDLKADRTTVTDLEHRVSNAEILIDGANAAIGLKADQTVVSQIDTRMSAAEIAIDGLNSEIKLVATQKTIEDMVERLSAAEVEIDGLDAKIKLLATESSIEELVTRITAAEVAIDGANSTLDLWAGELDAMGNRLSGAELLIDGQNSLIAAKADKVRVEALETEIAGVLKVENLQAAIADLPVLMNGSIQSDSIDSTHIECQSLDVNVALSIGGETAATQQWVKDQGYVTSATLTNYATRSWVIERNYTTASDVAQTLDSYVMQGELDGYATEAWVRENFSKASATYKPTVIERYGSVSGNSIPVQALNESGEVLLTATVDAGDVYSSGSTAGKNGVTLSATGWQGGSNVVKASNGKSLTVNLPTFSVSGGDSFNSNHQSTVYFYTSSVTGPLKSKNVDATPVYNSGYDAGYSSGETTGYNVGYAQAKPASVSRTAGYDASNNAYNVTVVVMSSDNTTRTYALEAISAREARNAGFNSGYDSGYTDGQASIDTGAYYDEGYEIGYSAGYAAGFKAAKDAVKVTAGISWSNPAQYYAMVRYWGRATINGEEVGYASASESKNISGYV